jgi:hypothetical protein
MFFYELYIILQSKEQKSNITLQNNQKVEVIDSTYKLFYGTWEVTNVIGTSKLSLDINNEEDTLEKAKQTIGRIITYEKNSIKNDNIEVYKNPHYKYAIIPVKNPEFEYIMYFSNVRELGLNGNYFVFVEVDIQDYGDTTFGSNFYIKDDDTLIAFYYDVEYELKRVSYIENADIMQQYR